MSIESAHGICRREMLRRAGTGFGDRGARPPGGPHRRAIWMGPQLRKKLGLRCTPVRRVTTTTDSTHALPVAENVLAHTFVATRPNETWVTDITYVPTAAGFLFLAVALICAEMDRVGTCRDRARVLF